MPTATVRSARGVAAKLRHVVQGERRQGEDADGRARRAGGVEHGRRDPLDEPALSFGPRHDRGDVGACLGPFRDDDHRQRETGVDGIGDQVRPFEEHVVGVAVGGVAAACDERMAAAGDDGLGHGGRRTAAQTPMVRFPRRWPN